MADTLPNVVIPANTWIDLYAQTGITVGTRIRVKLIGGTDVRLVVSATQPADLSASDVLTSRVVPYLNSEGDSGAWAYCVAGGAEVNVGVV